MAEQFNYSGFIISAAKMIKRFGVQGTLHRAPGGTFDPVEGENYLVDPIEAHPVVMLLLPASKGTTEAFDNAFKHLGPAMVEKINRFAIFAADGLEVVPEYGDRVQYGTATATVIGSTPLAPNGEPILYRVGMSG